MTGRPKFLFRKPDHDFGAQVDPVRTIRFRSNELFTGMTGTVDFDDCVVRGVSMITGNMEAEGHGLMVDDTTTNQLFSLAKEAGQIPVYLDHGSGIKDLNGYLDNFRMDGKKLRADWHLLESHDETQVMLERADRQPKTFGLSVAFKGKGVKVMGGKKAARATKLLSADVVPRPAANADGLFGAKDDVQLTGKTTGMNRNAKDPTLEDIMNGLNALTTRIDQMQGIQDQLVAHINGDVENREQNEEADSMDPQILAELDEMSDEELAAYNEANGTEITREDINAAVADYVQSTQGNQNGRQEERRSVIRDIHQELQDLDQEGEGEQGDYDDGYEGAGNGEAVGAGAGAGGSEGSTAFAALNQRLIQLQARLDQREKSERKQARQIRFKSIEDKVLTLAGQRDQLHQLAENLVAENEALKLHVRTGTRPVRAGVDDGVRLFSANEDGELHQFQQVVKNVMAQKKCTEGQAIAFAIKQPGGNALHKDWLMSMSAARSRN